MSSHLIDHRQTKHYQNNGEKQPNSHVVRVAAAQVVDASTIICQDEAGQKLNERPGALRMTFSITVDPQSNSILFANEGRAHALHPVWLRERTTEPDTVDQGSGQRLYDPSSIDPDLSVEEIHNADEWSTIVWSDGHRQSIIHELIAQEIGWTPDPMRLPAPTPWAIEPEPFPRLPWPADDDLQGQRNALEAFWTHGFVVFTGTPTTPGDLTALAGRFGTVRPTNFGTLFDVYAKPNPVDLAYTPRELTPHTDNPYRRPVPSIQFLHCLENNATGGESTLVDGLAAFEDFARRNPEAHEVLCSVPVSFRYHFGDETLMDRSTILERGTDGTFVGIRNSDRLDFVDAVDVDTLDRFYRGRTALRSLLGDESRRALFLLGKGDLLMMDNRRLLHGRLSYQLESGLRHLQGCYIEHDGPELLWRQLSASAI